MSETTASQITAGDSAVEVTSTTELLLEEEGVGVYLSGLDQLPAGSTVALSLTITIGQPAAPVADFAPETAPAMPPAIKVRQYSGWPRAAEPQ